MRNIMLFILLVNGLAWLGPWLGGSPTEPGPGLFVWGSAPLVAALIMRWLVRDRISFGMRPVLRANSRWYLLSLLYYPVTIAITLMVGTALGVVVFHEFSPAALLPVILPTMVIYLVFGFFEEVGWRGYLTPRMQMLNDGLAGYLLIGIVWAAWHLPYMAELWGHSTESMVTFVPRFVLGSTISAVLYGEIRQRTGTFWPAVLMHWTGNTIANTLLTGIVTLVPGWEWLGTFGASGFFMMIMAALLGGWLYHRRRNHARITSTLQPEWSQQ